MPNEQKSRNKWFIWWMVVLVLAGGLLASLLMNAVLLLSHSLSGGRSGSGGGKGEDEYPQYTEQHSYGSGRTKVVRIVMDGPIFRQAGGGLLSAPYDPVARVLSEIRAAGHDRAVRGIVMEINSPGGAVTPSDEIYNALENFKAGGEDRKVIVFTRDLAASGGYYIAAAGDWIVAEPTSIVGSIGVIMQALNWKELADKVGLDNTTIKSGANKDMLNPFEEVDPQDVALLQNLIDSTYERFFNIVRESRGLDRDALLEIADGRVLDAESALRAGLVDQIGYWDDVVEKTAELLGVNSVKMVRYTRSGSFLDLLMQMRAAPAGPGLASIWEQARTPRLLYLWRP